MSSTVSAELELRYVGPQRTIEPLVACLFYSREDPYTIRMTFHVEFQEPVEWTFARDLLSTGIQEREGPGDITVWPSAGSAGGAPGSVLNIKLSSPHGYALFEGPIGKVYDFLRRTYQIVPPGEESRHLDIETGLDDLLRQAS